MTRAWITAVVAASTLVIAACSGDDSDADPSTASSTSSATTAPQTTEATSTSNAPTTSSFTTTSPPSTGTASTVGTTTSPPVAADDWRAIVEHLGRRRQELYAAPDVSRIGEVCAGDSQCFQQLDVQLADLASKGWRVVGADPYTVLEATVERFDGETLESSLLVTVVATVERPDEAGRIIDNGGATVADVEAETEVGFNSRGRVILARVGPEDDPWRMVSQERLREVPS